MLTVGEKFPAYAVTATVSTDKNKAFETITDESYPGKWKVYFFWPKDFTFVCPTEIAAFGKLNAEFEARDAQILGITNFVDTSDVPLSKGSTTDAATEQDNQKLFALYTAVNNLSYLASMSNRSGACADWTVPCGANRPDQ